MRFAYSTNAFKKHSLEETLRLISAIGGSASGGKGIGFTGVEIMADRPHLYPPDYARGELAVLKAQLKSLGLAVSNLNTFTLFAIGDMHHPSWIEKSPDQRAIRIKHTKDCLRLARELDCPNISIQPGGRVEHLTREESMRVFLDGLSEVIPEARRYGVKILVEPEPNLLMESAAQFREFIRKVDQSVIGLNCDLGHFYCAGEDPAAVLAEFAPVIKHIHIEDIRNRVHDHKICGQGEMDFWAIFQALRRIKYDGFISLELYPYQDNPVEAGQESLRFLAKYL